MKTTTRQKLNRRALWPCALLLLVPALAGCGGGGSAATSPAQVQPAAVVLSGTIQDASGNPLNGYTVVYTPSSTATAKAVHSHAASGTLSTTTNSQGYYSLSVPAAQITTNATLAVYDTSGAQVQSQTLTLNPSQPTQTSTVTVTTAAPLTPPAPPAPPA